MKFENNKIYTSNQEIQELKHSIELLNSSDKEIYKLGIKCIQSIIPKGSVLNIVFSEWEIKGIVIGKNYILIKDWIIE